MNSSSDSDSENINNLDTKKNKNNKYILIITHVITFISGGVSMHLYMNL